jgi:diadenosine tetraphosphatase ApaH/serine/threonine PP2A family protein phosphatase
MRYAILSDIHGNYEALSAVFRDIARINGEYGSPMDQVWCLGDVVGYGPEPSECVHRVRSSCDICIAGNHDWAAIEKLDLSDFSKSAAASARWTRSQLKTEEQTYLRLLPETTRVRDFTLAHGSPSNPIWEYLTTEAIAAYNFPAFETIFCVVGHSHLPTIFLQPLMASAPLTAPIRRAMEPSVALAMATPGGPSRLALEGGESGGQHSRQSSASKYCTRIIPAPGLWIMPADHRAIINPGSVGQPRDGDSRASYIIYDSQVGFEFRRVGYDIKSTTRKISDRGLPSQLAERLAKGI